MTDENNAKEKEADKIRKVNKRIQDVNRANLRVGGLRWVAILGLWFLKVRQIKIAHF